MREALRRECGRGRRYDRRVALVLLRLELPLSDEFLSTAGRILRSSVRAVDLPCYLGDGSFAVVLPEATVVDAQRVHRRLDAALARELGALRPPAFGAAVVELRADEDPVSFFDRAQRTLTQTTQDDPPAADGARRELYLASA
jgi:GGDEF domain-containing protein